MANSSNYFIYTCNNISLSFIIISFIFVIFLMIINPLIKFKKIKNKWITNRNLIFFSSILGLLVGIIFSSMSDFSKLNYHDIDQYRWLWDAISFVYSFGSLIISFLLMGVWFLIPLMCFRMVKKFLTRADYNIDHELRKLGFVFLFIIITISVSNIGWTFPLNDPATPLKIFKINNGVFNHDQWFVANKWMYENVYLTEWYSWVFIAYFLLNVIICYICIRVNINNIYYLVNTEKRLKKIGMVFHVFDSFGSLSCYCFISAYFLFNWEMLFTHIGYMLMILAITYILVIGILLLSYSIKFRNDEHKWLELKNMFEQGFINHFSTKKPKIKFNAINITDVSIVALAFTIYMSFAYNYDVINNEIIYNEKMHSFTFWFQIVLNSFIFNIVSESRSYNSSWTKMVFSEATYSVAPGLQTSILGWINPLFKPFSNFVNNITALMV